METPLKLVKVKFIRVNSLELLKAVAEDGMSVSVPIEYRRSRKENEIVLLNVRASKNFKFYVAVGLNETREEKAMKQARELFKKRTSLAN